MNNEQRPERAARSVTLQSPREVAASAFKLFIVIALVFFVGVGTGALHATYHLDNVIVAENEDFDAVREAHEKYVLSVETERRELRRIFQEIARIAPSPKNQFASHASNRVRRVGIGGGSERRSVLYTNSSLINPSQSSPGVSQESENPSSIFDGEIADVLRRVPIGLPVRAPISSSFGGRQSPHTGLPQFHTGVDFAAERGSPVVATAYGTVHQVGYLGGYGLSVVIDHGNGWQTLYAHLSRVSVPVGAVVRRGEKVGLVGDSGNSTGPHLHYEVRVDSKAMNPMRFVQLAAKFFNNI
jgi:murein DD-endopeptidase MepM/ murein hydrolase activator NlpD